MKTVLIVFLCLVVLTLFFLIYLVARVSGLLDNWRLKHFYVPLFFKNSRTQYYKRKVFGGIYFVPNRRRGDGWNNAFSILRVTGADEKSFRVHYCEEKIDGILFLDDPKSFEFGVDDSNSFWMHMKLPFHIPDEPISYVLDGESWYPTFVTKKGVYKGSAFESYAKSSIPVS